jgi:hypothetical protein
VTKEAFMHSAVFFAGVIGVTMVAAGSPPEIYVNGNIYTGDPARPRVEAMAIADRTTTAIQLGMGGLVGPLPDSRVLAIGSNAEIRDLAGPQTKVVDLEGRTVLPGLIDCHGHVGSLGAFGLGRLDLSSARSFDDLVTAVKEASLKGEKGSGGGEWILGGRWDHESWSSRELPTHKNLSDAVPDRPVWLRRVDGHAALANAAAMRAAGVSKDTQSPPGGEIIKGSDGEPTGVFIDTAMSLVERHVPAGALAHSAEDLILKAQAMCLSVGLTGVHDAGVSPAEIETYAALEKSGKLKLRIYAMVAGPHAMKYFDQNQPTIGDRLTVRAAKLYIDGAMGSRGAWLLEPYADRPTDGAGKPYAGLAVGQPEFIEAVASHALQRGYQVCTHAIGDRGNREVLQAYANALASHRSFERPDHRFRIEHAQLLSPADIPRLGAMGIIASMQPTHCTSDMRWVEARVGGERAKGAYAWASLIRSGARLAGGSDFPVESHNPFLGFYAATTRQDAEGNPAGGWQAQERMTREEALRCFTADAAYAAFEEEWRGSLSPGKVADFIVIDRDVMTCPERDILETKVLRTVIGGEEVYEGANEER